MYITLIKGSIWTLINVLVLSLITYLDHNYIWSETALNCLTIPVGLINCALFVVWIPRFIKGDKYTKVLAVFACLNAIYCLTVFNDLYVLGGSL